MSLDVRPISCKSVLSCYRFITNKMRINENTKIVGKNVILIPYEDKHVEKYHGWMQSKDLQELTASEPLSLDEEYEMQRNWREDENKCTFLILDRKSYESTNNEILTLIGDTNLFLRHDNDNDGIYEPVKVAEVEIMIAEPQARGKGFGWEAILLMLKYATKYLDIKCFEVKIGMRNEKSLRMFKKIQFSETSRSEVFQEVTLQRTVDENWLQWLDKEVHLSIAEYR